MGSCPPIHAGGGQYILQCAGNGRGSFDGVVDTMATVEGVGVAMVAAEEAGTVAVE